MSADIANITHRPQIKGRSKIRAIIQRWSERSITLFHQALQGRPAAAGDQSVVYREPGLSLK
jgi:hypothetical protein